MMNLQKEVLLGPMKTGIEYEQDEVVNWIESIINPLTGSAAASTESLSRLGSSGSSSGVRRSSSSSRMVVGGLRRGDEDLGVSARSLMKRIGFDWNLSIEQMETSLRENDATDVSGLRLVARSLLKREALPMENVDAFSRAVEDKYLTVPFHNSYHAAQVAHHANVLVEAAGIRSYLTRPDTMALTVAALCHDISHFGRSNAFLVETRHELAVRYNDNSVLENFHCSVTFQIIKSSPATDITGSLSKQEERRFRSRVIQLIMSTDSATHFHTVGELRMRLEEGKLFTDPAAHENDRRIALQSILRAADLGYHAMAQDVHIDWVHRLAEEYAQQGDDERSLGLPVSPMCDRTSQDVPSMQIGFMNLVVMPLYDELFNLVRIQCPSAVGPFTSVCEALVNNHSYWTDIRRVGRQESLMEGCYIPSPTTADLIMHRPPLASEEWTPASPRRDTSDDSDDTAVVLTYSQAHG